MYFAILLVKMTYRADYDVIAQIEVTSVMTKISIWSIYAMCLIFWIYKWQPVFLTKKYKTCFSVSVVEPPGY